LAKAGEGAARAARALDRLGEVEGQAAFVQRAEKKLLQDAAQPAPSGGAGGFAYGAKLRDIDKDKEVTVLGLKTVGNQSLYRRGKIWITPSAAEVDLEKEAEKIVTIDRFTEEYFKLVSANTADENQLLASQQPDDELLIQLRGKVYRIK
jgi:Ca-activated chloride channel family protein